MYKIKDMSLFEVLQIASDEDAVEKLFVEMRWPDGVACPKCGSTKVWPRRNRKPQPFHCGERECFYDFSVKVDTPMHGSNLPLSKWFLAVHLMYTHPKGMSSVTMAKHLGVSQKTAWFLNHRIREAWRNPDDEIFDGPVEVDETFVGGKKKNMPRRKKMDMPKGHMPDNKTIVIGMKDRATKHVVAEVLPTRTAMAMRDFVYKHINRGDTTVYTDAHPAYSSLPNHDSVKHSQWGTGEYVRGEVYTNGIEGFWTLIKRGYMGVYHYMSKKHMPKYAVEYTERNNARVEGMTTMDVLYQIVSRMVGRRLTFNQLRNTRIKTEDEICKEIFDRYRALFAQRTRKPGWTFDDLVCERAERATQS